MNQSRGIWESVREWFAPRPSRTFKAPLLVVNVTRGTVLATQMEPAHTGATRRKGLLGRDGLMPGGGLWIAPCESVHTFFMRFAIDLVYLDRENQIKKVRSSIGPWRMSACFSAHSVLELPAGTVNATQTEAGDTVEIGPAPAESNAA